MLPLTGVVRLVGEGQRHMFALLRDGSVAAFGNNNESGVLGDGSEEERLMPVTVSGLSDIADVATGSGRSYAMCRVGRV